LLAKASGQEHRAWLTHRIRGQAWPLQISNATNLDPRGLQPTLYGFFMPQPTRRSRSFTGWLLTIGHKRQSPYDGVFSMSVLDGVSLLLAAGLFIYLLVALLRAGRN